MFTVPHKMKGVRVALIAALFILCSGVPASAQSAGGWWGSNYWFDWSDFRASMGARAYLATLTSGTVRINGQQTNLQEIQLNLARGSKLMYELHAELYVDRLGIRLDFEDYRFEDNSQYLAGELLRVHELRLGGTRLGLDLDLVRYPFLRCGINYDYGLAEVQFRNRSNSNSIKHVGDNPMTLGFHGFAIPGRLRDIPITMSGRVRFPIPFLHRDTVTKITDWQLSGGLRPAIWDTSLYGHSTFSVGLEGGYRSVNLECEPSIKKHSNSDNANFAPLQDYLGNADLNLHWQGPFVQLNLVF